LASAVITAAVNGPIATKADNPHLPTTPAEIAAAAKGAHEAGASVVHVHLRGEDGRPTADLEIARRVVGEIEDACPILIQLSPPASASASPSRTARGSWRRGRGWPR
jgi:uncharacterized protein (DUF849 family)